MARKYLAEMIALVDLNFLYFADLFRTMRNDATKITLTNKKKSKVNTIEQSSI